MKKSKKINEKTSLKINNCKKDIKHFLEDDNLLNIKNENFKE